MDKEFPKYSLTLQQKKIFSCVDNDFNFSYQVNVTCPASSAALALKDLIIQNDFFRTIVDVENNCQVTIPTEYLTLHEYVEDGRTPVIELTIDNIVYLSVSLIPVVDDLSSVGIVLKTQGIFLDIEDIYLIKRYISDFENQNDISVYHEIQYIDYHSWVISEIDNMKQDFEYQENFLSVLRNQFDCFTLERINETLNDSKYISHNFFIEGEIYDRVMDYSLQLGVNQSVSVLFVLCQVLSCYQSNEVLSFSIKKRRLHDNALRYLFGDISWIDLHEINVASFTEAGLLTFNKHYNDKNIAEIESSNYLKYLNYLSKDEDYSWSKKIPVIIENINNSHSRIEEKYRQKNDALLYITYSVRDGRIEFSFNIDERIINLSVIKYIFSLIEKSLFDIELLMRGEYKLSNVVDSLEDLSIYKDNFYNGNNDRDSQEISFAWQRNSEILNKTAVFYQSKTITYAEFLEKIKIKMKLIRDNGITPSHCLCLLLNRSLELVEWVVAAFRSSIPILILNPDLGRKLIDERMFTASATHAISMDESGLSKLTDLQCKSNKYNILNGIAYMLYTSGSMGEPKLIKISRDNMSIYLDSLSRRLSIDNEDVYGVTASVGFSSLFRQIFLPLINGGTIAIFSENETKDPSKFFDIARDSSITILDLTPSHAEMLFDYHRVTGDVHESSIKLRKLLFASEPLNWDLVDKLKKISFLSNAQIVNMYGQTESSGIVSTYVLGDYSEDCKGKVPVGMPLFDHSVLILDNDNNLAPRFSLGNIAVSSPAVAFHTPKVEISNYFGSEWYITGDIGKINMHGEIEYIRRIDRQIKLSGKKVCLSEIENAIVTHPAVKNIYVLFDKKKNIIYAYVLPSTHQKPSSIELKHHVKEVLPDYMVPSLYFYLNDLPLSKNAKIDYKFLEHQYLNETAESSKKDFSSKYFGNIQQFLYNTYSELLNTQAISPEDDLFSLGLDSLKSAQSITKIADRFKVELLLAEIFENPTILSISERIESL